MVDSFGPSEPYISWVGDAARCRVTLDSCVAYLLGRCATVSWLATRWLVGTAEAGRRSASARQRAPWKCDSWPTVLTLSVDSPRQPAPPHVSHTNYTHTRLTALFPGLPGWAGTRKVKPIWILLRQETVSGSGINWAVCKSAPRSRQTTTPAPHHSVFYRPDALPAAQPTASKQWRHSHTRTIVNLISPPEAQASWAYVLLMFFLIFSDFCQTNYLNISQLSHFRIGRTLAVDERPEVIFFDPSGDFAVAANFLGKTDVFPTLCSSHGIR